jgi:hypothetical protein
MPHGMRLMNQDRDQIMDALLKNVDARLDGYVEEWLANPEFRARLHRYERPQPEMSDYIERYSTPPAV